MRLYVRWTYMIVISVLWVWLRIMHVSAYEYWLGVAHCLLELHSLISLECQWIISFSFEYAYMESSSFVLTIYHLEINFHKFGHHFHYKIIIVWDYVHDLFRFQGLKWFPPSFFFVGHSVFIFSPWVNFSGFNQWGATPRGSWMMTFVA